MRKICIYTDYDVILEKAIECDDECVTDIDEMVLFQMAQIRKNGFTNVLPNGDFTWIPPDQIIRMEAKVGCEQKECCKHRK